MTPECSYHPCCRRPAVPAMRPWQGLGIAQHSSSEYRLGLLCWEKCLLSPVGLWQLFKCDLNMLGWALQNIFKQELPLYRKMEILLLRKPPELGFISETSDNNRKKICLRVFKVLHIYYLHFLHLWGVGAKKKKNHVKNLKHRNPQSVSKAILITIIISTTITTPATSTAISHKTYYRPRTMQNTTSSLFLNSYSTPAGVLSTHFLGEENKAQRVRFPSP